MAKKSLTADLAELKDSVNLKRVVKVLLEVRDGRKIDLSKEEEDDIIILQHFLIDTLDG